MKSKVKFWIVVRYNSHLKRNEAVSVHPRSVKKFWKNWCDLRPLSAARAYDPNGCLFQCFRDDHFDETLPNICMEHRDGAEYIVPGKVRFESGLIFSEK